MVTYVWVAIGSALGGVARYGCSGLAARMIGETFPWGHVHRQHRRLLHHWILRHPTGPDGRYMVGSVARQFVMAGFCGGFTTFSSFSLQTLNLMNDGEWFRAGAVIRGSVASCLIAVWAGHMLAASISTMKWI
jgi:CrcB protein